jgi:hypothetical protein
MHDRLASLQAAVDAKNWWAALALALSLPDVASKLDGRSGNRAHYISWAQDYLTPKYTARIGADRENHVFLSGRDC